MITASLKIIALGGDFWSSEPIRVLVADALVCERRIQKKSNLDTERLRYNLLCKQIEDQAADRPDQMDTVQLRPEYFDSLDQVRRAVGKDPELVELLVSARFGATYFPPHLVKANLEAFQDLITRGSLDSSAEINKRNEFISLVLRGQKDGNSAIGFVEVQAPFLESILIEERSKLTKKIPVPMMEKADDRSNPENIPQAEKDNAFHNEIQKALMTGSAVNFSSPTHIAITNELHRFVYDKDGLRDQKIRVIYGDGTEAEPFLLRCRSTAVPYEDLTRVTDAPILRASLLSMRHLEQDLIVDMAWFINQQASRPRSFAETDKFCYEQTLKQLEKIRKPARLYLYQTGLQPAVVGFYRALIYWFKRQPQYEMSVIPYFYQPSTDDYSYGDAWI